MTFGGMNRRKIMNEFKKKIEDVLCSIPKQPNHLGMININLAVHLVMEVIENEFGKKE